MDRTEKMLLRGWLMMMLEKFKQGQQFDVQQEMERTVEIIGKELDDAN